MWLYFYSYFGGLSLGPLLSGWLINRLIWALLIDIWLSLVAGVWSVVTVVDWFVFLLGTHDFCMYSTGWSAVILDSDLLPVPGIGRSHIRLGCLMDGW